MITKKVNRLLKINKNFLGLTVIPCAIFIVLFFVLLLVSITHPILMLLSVLLICPGCWLFVQLLFKYKTKLQNDIKIHLTKSLRQELQKEFEANNLNVLFDLKISSFTDSSCYFNFYYSSCEFYKLYSFHVESVEHNINDMLPPWFDITLFPKEDKTLQSNIVV